MKCTEICNTGALVAMPQAHQAQVKEELYLCTG
jgi:hypothetical protein